MTLFGQGGDRASSILSMQAAQRGEPDVVQTGPHADAHHQLSRQVDGRAMGQGQAHETGGGQDRTGDEGGRAALRIDGAPDSRRD